MSASTMNPTSSTRRPSPGGRAALLAAVLLLAMFGCDTIDEPAEPAPDAPTRPLRLLVLDDPPLAEAVRREWTARGGAPLEVETGESGTLVAGRRLGADAVIFPQSLLGEFGESGVLAPIDQSRLDEPAFQWRDTLPSARLQAPMWNQQLLALSLGEPTLVLYYRDDLLERAGLAPPSTWVEYQIAAERLSELAGQPREGQPVFSALAEPCAPGWAARVLLARAAAYAFNPEGYSCLFRLDTMDPLIDQPAFVRALEDMLAARRHAPADSLDWTPDDVRRAARRGEVAMALTWPSPVEPVEDDAVPEVVEHLRLVEPPGAEQYHDRASGEWVDTEPRRVTVLGLAGRLGAIARESNMRGSALQLLMFLAGPEVGARLSTESRFTGVYRQSHARRAEAWVEGALPPEAVASYTEAVEAAQRRSVWIHIPRIPGAARYMEALDRQTRAALSDETTPQAALEAAAAEWRAITEELGVESQRRAYFHHFGLTP